MQHDNTEHKHTMRKGNRFSHLPRNQYKCGFAKAPRVESLGSPSSSPFEVPPFAPPPPAAITYVWWSWHPRYPYWSQSCWRAATIEEAQPYLTDPRTGLTVYHNKLIRHDGITLVEVQDVPCRDIEVWHKIKRQMDEANAEVSDRRAHGNENTTGANGGSLH